MTRSLRSYLLRIEEFGFLFFVRYHILGRRKGRRYKQQVILDYIKKDIAKTGITSGYETSETKSMETQPIWVCWWQGEEQMPNIVKACYKSILKHANGHPVHLIYAENVSEYINIPKIIESKCREGIISLAHFSDIIRFSVLNQYGGLWIDATMYLTSNIPECFPTFYTLKQSCKDDQYVSDYRWSGYFIGGNNGNRLFEMLSNYLIHYWTNRKSLIDYYLFDYVIAAIYEKDENCRKMIDSVPESNPRLHLLQPMLNSEFENEEMNRLTSNTSFFKLSWKESYSSHTEEGKITYYGQLIKNEL